jgi:hypothetical protein
MIRTPTAVILRAQVVLTAIALAAAVVLVVVSSWPLKIIMILAFIRGLFASDLIALRSEPRAHRISNRAAIPAPHS